MFPPMRRAIVSTAGVVTRPVDDASIVDAMKATSKVLWLDLQKPGPEDIRLLREGFGFHPLSIEDLGQTHTAAKLDEYDSYVFQVVMVPYRTGPDEIELFEVEIFYLQGTLVTVHDRAWAPIDALWDAVGQNPVRELGKGAQVLYHSVVDRAVDEYFPLLDTIDDQVEVLEREVFESNGESILPRLFRLRRSVRQMGRAARNQRESVQRLAGGFLRTLHKETCYQFRDVYDHLILLHDSLEDHRETLGGLRDTYVGVVNNRMSQVMKSLTVFSAILLPLAFVTGLWGMNVRVPWEGDITGFWVVLGVCAALSTGIILWVTRRGWLRDFS
jgi:magnesium transporter